MTIKRRIKSVIKRGGNVMESESNIGLSAFYAFLAAIIGGIIWAVIVVITEYELGLIAWAIGGLTGYAVVLPAKNSVDKRHQVIAVIASLVGIILGKYFYFSYIFNDGLSGLFSFFTVDFFFGYFSTLFGGYDIIFVLFAVVTAWQIPGNFAKTANQEPQEPIEEENTIVNE